MPVNNTLLNDEDSMGHEHVNASDGVRYHSDLLLLPCAPIGLTLWALAQGQLSLAMLSGGLLCLLLAIVLERGSSPKPLSEVLPTVFLASCVHGAAIVALLILAGLWPPGTAPRLVWGAVAAGLSLALIALAQGRSGDKKMERWLVTLSLGSALLSGGLGMLP